MMHELMCNDVWINVNYAGLVNYCVLMYEKMWLPYTVYALLIFCVCIKCLLIQHKTLLPLYRVFMRSTVRKAFSIVGSLEVAFSIVFMIPIFMLIEVAYFYSCLLFLWSTSIITSLFYWIKLVLSYLLGNI